MEMQPKLTRPKGRNKSRPSDEGSADLIDWYNHEFDDETKAKLVEKVPVISKTGSNKVNTSDPLWMLDNVKVDMSKLKRDCSGDSTTSSSSTATPMLASLSMDGSPALVASADASPVDVAVQGLEQVLEQMDALSLGPAVDLDAVDEDLEVEEDSEDEPVLTGNEPRRGLLYLGGWKVSYGAWCRVNNIKFILCCARTKDIEAAGTDSRRRRWHSDSKQLEREGVAFHRLPWADHARQRLWSNRPFDQLAEAVLKLHQALARGDNCLVHCRKGRSRSATVVAAYLMARRGLGRTDAINWIRARRPSAGPNSGFMQQLLDLQRSPVIAYLRERVGVAALEDRQRYLERKARERRDRKERHGEKAHHGHRHRNRVAERAAAAAGSALGGVAEAAAVVVVDEQPAAVAVAE